MGFFKGGRFNLEKRPASSYFRSEYRALVEILVSHLSAQDAERWGSLFLGEGEMEWDCVLWDARPLDCDREDRLLPVRHADRSVRATQYTVAAPRKIPPLGFARGRLSPRWRKRGASG